MRVSEKQRFDKTLTSIETTKDNNVKTLDVLASQKRINHLSDDPIGQNRVVRNKETISDYERFARNVDYAKGFVEMTESAVSSIHDQLIRAHELAMGMANDTYGPDSRKAVSKEVEQIIDEVIKLANSKYNSKFVFSGFRSLYPSVDRDGEFLGDDGNIFLQIDKDIFTKINVPGRSFFLADSAEREVGHFNLIEGLKVLKQGLESNEKQTIYKSLDEISYQMEKASNFQASIGAIWGGLGHASNRIELSKENVIKDLSQIEDADIYEATSNFKRTEAVLQSTLLAGNKILQPSLLNFMQ